MNNLNSNHVDRIVMHADMDAFFASIEQRDNTLLKNRPIAVGGNGARGVVAAASYEARLYGVHSAMPSVDAKRLCPDIIFVPSNMKKYRSESDRLFRILQNYSPLVERVSVDEAYLDLTGSSRLLGEPLEVGEQLRNQIYCEMLLTVSVGIAPVKMVAKIASRLAKPNGLLEVNSNNVEKFLAPLPARYIGGIGPVTCEKLNKLGLKTIGDLVEAGDDLLHDILGDWGLKLKYLAQGKDNRPVKSYEERLSVGEEKTFEKDVLDKKVLDYLIRKQADSIAKSLRQRERYALTVIVKWKTSNHSYSKYYLKTRQKNMGSPTNDGYEIYNHARNIMTEHMPNKPIRLLGLICTNLTSLPTSQIQIFDNQYYSHRHDLNKVLDNITHKFGDKAIGKLNFIKKR